MIASLSELLMRATPGHTCKANSESGARRWNRRYRATFFPAAGMVAVLIQRIRATMVKRSLRQSCLLACFAIVAGLFSAAPSSPSERPLRQVVVNLADTGKTVALSVGQVLIVTLPLRRYDDNYWYVARNSGAALKLIAGPNERRPRNWTPGVPSSQVFYFRRDSPGIAHLVLEGSYWSKPMLLEVVDR
jgi:hypothetical protein